MLDASGALAEAASDLHVQLDSLEPWELTELQFTVAARWQSHQQELIRSNRPPSRHSSMTATFHVAKNVAVSLLQPHKPPPQQRRSRATPTPDQPLSALEIERLQNICRNKEALARLGLG